MMDSAWLEQWKDQDDHDERIPFCIFAVGAAHEATNGWENWTEALDPEWKEAIEQENEERIQELCDRDGIGYPQEPEDDPRLDQYDGLFEEEPA